MLNNRLLLIACCTAALLLPGSSLLGGEAEQVEAFLSRLGLADLRIQLLEQEVAKAAAADARLSVARRLADSYAERMLSVADDKPRYDDLQQRIQKLLAETPGASTLALQVALLQADYQRAESLIIAWLDDPGHPAPRDEAQAILARIAPQLQSHREAFAAQVEKLAAQLDAAEEDVKTESEAELVRRQAMSARTAYFTGWAHYYWGLAKQDPTQAQGEFKTALEAFCEVLGIVDEMDFAEVEVDALALESIWRTRAAIGLGLSLVGLDRPAAGERVFSWLQHASVPPDLRDQAAYWQLQALLNVGKMAEAVALAEGQVERFAGITSPGKNSFCIALLRAAFAGEGPKRPESAALAEFGIRGLARLRQYDLLDQLFVKYKVDASRPDAGFYLTWLHGRQQFLAAEKSKDAAEYRATLATLSRALAMPTAQQDLNAAGQCRYCVAWCHYRLEETALAASEFHEAAAALRTSYPSMAEQAAWMECVARQALAAKDKKLAAAAVSALQAFKLSYPASAQLPKAELLILKLQEGAAGTEASLQSLAAIAPGDPNYAAAQFEISQLLVREWRKARAADPVKAVAQASAALTAIDRFLAAAGTGAAEQKLRAALAAIEIASASKASDERRLAGYQAQAQAAAEMVSEASPLLPEFHYRRLQAAQKAGDNKAAGEAAAWLAKNGVGTPYELPALIIVARAADASVAAASAADRPDRLAAAMQAYGRLAKLLGETPSAIAEVKNALVVNSRLAQYEEELGQWKAAAARLESIVAAFPSDRKYLRRAGLAQFQAGDFAKSLDLWGKLLAGLDSGSDDWLEAKYHQLACLERTDRETARKVWKQFALLYPEVRSPWGEKFQELKRRLET